MDILSIHTTMNTDLSEHWLRNAAGHIANALDMNLSLKQVDNAVWPQEAWNTFRKWSSIGTYTIAHMAEYDKVEPLSDAESYIGTAQSDQYKIASIGTHRYHKGSQFWPNEDKEFRMSTEALFIDSPIYSIHVLSGLKPTHGKQETNAIEILDKELGDALKPFCWGEDTIIRARFSIYSLGDLLSSVKEEFQDESVAKEKALARYQQSDRTQYIVPSILYLLGAGSKSLPAQPVLKVREI